MERKARRRGFDFNVVLAYTVTKSSHTVTKDVPLQLFKNLAPGDTLPIAVSKENPENITIVHPSIPADMRGGMKFWGVVAGVGLVLIWIGRRGKKEEPEGAEAE